MYSMACFVRISAKLNDTAFHHYLDALPFEKKLCKHVLISQCVQESLLTSDKQRSTRDVICKIAKFKMVDI